MSGERKRHREKTQNFFRQHGVRSLSPLFIDWVGVSDGTGEPQPQELI